MSTSTDGRSKSSKQTMISVEPEDSSDDESSVEDIFESPPQRPKRPVSIAAKNGLRGPSIFGKNNNPLGGRRHLQTKSDGLFARTAHDRSSRGVQAARRQSSRDSGNLSDGDIRLDSRPRAPARKKSLDYEDFLTLRETHANEGNRDRTPTMPTNRRPDYFPKK
jgi:hypothetical protein